MRANFGGTFTNPPNPPELVPTTISFRKAACASYGDAHGPMVMPRIEF